MKHLIAQEHRSHLKKRAILELVGLIVLAFVSFNQRDLIISAVETIKKSDPATLVEMVVLYWVLLPLTSISYQLLSEKRVRIMPTVLAQLAAAGPGRIIPGGLGHISIAAMHLSHEGIKLRKAILIIVANNIIGFIVHAAIIVGICMLYPEILIDLFEHVSLLSIATMVIATVVLATLFLWLSHIRSTRNTIRRVNREWSTIFAHLLRHPQRIAELIIVAAIITFGHMTMLLVSGEAVSVHIQPTHALLALGFGVFVGGALPTPGGLGAVEAGVTTALIALGYKPADAASAAILFRVATYWVPLIPGIFAYTLLRRRAML